MEYQANGHSTKNGQNLREVYLNDILPRVMLEIFQESGNGHDFAWQESGDRLRGRCPHHKSSSGTSLYVVPSEMRWACAVCTEGRRHDVLSWQHWLRTGDTHVVGQDFIDGVRELGKRVGVQIPDKQLTSAEVKRQSLWRENVRLLTLMTEISEGHLWSNAGKDAREYLNKRGLSDEWIKNFGIGLFPGVATAKQVYRGHEFNVHENFVKRAFQTAKNKDGKWKTVPYDGYLVVPWNDPNGEILTVYLAWLGKRLEANDPDYRPHKFAIANLKDTKGKVVFPSKESPLCFDIARKNGHKNLRLVEGLFDCLVAQSHGDTSVIAAIAANFSKAQIETLKRYSIKSVTSCMDGDDGGDRGTESCRKNLATVGIDFFVTPRLESGQDPDEFIIEHGIEAWNARFDEAESGSVWKTRQLLKVDKTKRQQKDATKAVCEFITTVDDVIERKECKQLLMDSTGITESEADELLVSPPQDKEDKKDKRFILARLEDALLRKTSGFARDKAGSLYRYERGVYVGDVNQYIKTNVREILEGWSKIKTWQSRLATELCEFLAAGSPPVDMTPSSDLINVRNGLLNVRTRELKPHTPRHLGVVQLPIAYDPQSKCPHVEEFFKQTMPDDCVDLAYQLFGWWMITYLFGFRIRRDFGCRRPKLYRVALGWTSLQSTSSGHWEDVKSRSTTPEEPQGSLLSRSRYSYVASNLSDNFRNARVGRSHRVGRTVVGDTNWQWSKN